MRQVWSLEELEESWSLSVADERALGARVVGANRLGFAVLSKFFELEAGSRTGRRRSRSRSWLTLPSRLALAGGSSPTTRGREDRTSGIVRRSGAGSGDSRDTAVFRS